MDTVTILTTKHDVRYGRVMYLQDTRQGLVPTRVAAAGVVSARSGSDSQRFESSWWSEECCQGRMKRTQIPRGSTEWQQPTCSLVAPP